MDRENKNIFNLRVAKFTTLYQILNPSTTKIYGYNVYHVLIVLLMLYMFTISMSLVASLYYLTNDIIGIALCFGYIENFIYACLKMINIIYYSKYIWKYTRVANASFMTYKHYNQNIYNSWQTRLALLNKLYLIVTYVVLFAWGSTPFIFNHASLLIRRADDSVEKYRMNVYNLFMIFPAEKYNEHFMIFFSFELLTMTSYAYFTIIFDILIFTMTLALSCQLDAISDAISSIGHNKHASDNVKLYGLYYFIDAHF